jgi:ribosomal protein S12 methylthiotransferase accessory factor
VRLEAFVSPITGIIPRLEKLPALDGMYVWAATQTVGGSSGRVPFQSNRALGQPNAAAGKGASDTQAKVSCLAEAVERYSCSYFGDEPRQRARLAELGQRGLDPSDLLQFSASQYARRDLTKSSRSLFTFVPMPFDPDRAIEWTPAWSLTRQRTVWLPTAFCYFGYRNPPDHDFCRADSNGCASGNTLEEAILQALMELVERDACAIWWYNRLVLRGIDLASFGDPFFDRIAETLARSGRNLDVLDLTNDLGITAAMAVSWERATGARIHLGLGCHLDPRIAVSRAVSELSQSLAFEYSPESERQVAFFDDHARWLDTQQIEDHPYLRACAGKLRSAAEFPDLSARDVRDDVIRCVELLEGKGLETIVLEHTRPDIGFPVARVAVPGLRHFWPRFAPGRLYDIPPLLGWRETASVEAELNSIGLFF